MVSIIYKDIHYSSHFFIRDFCRVGVWVWHRVKNDLRAILARFSGNFQRWPGYVLDNKKARLLGAPLIRLLIVKYLLIV
jgi:hypothetical protein